MESVGARLVYLPPYSPDFNPIELAWSKFKNHLRAVAARTRRALRPCHPHGPGLPHRERRPRLLSPLRL